MKERNIMQRGKIPENLFKLSLFLQEIGCQGKTLFGRFGLSSIGKFMFWFFWFVMVFIGNEVTQRIFTINQFNEIFLVSILPWAILKSVELLPFLLSWSIKKGLQIYQFAATERKNK